MQSDTTAFNTTAHFLPIGIPRATVAMQNKGVTSQLNRNKDDYSSQYRDLKKGWSSEIRKIHHLIVQYSTCYDRLPALENSQASNTVKRQAQLGVQSSIMSGKITGWPDQVLMALNVAPRFTHMSQPNSAPPGSLAFGITTGWICPQLPWPYKDFKNGYTGKGNVSLDKSFTKETYENNFILHSSIKYWLNVFSKHRYPSNLAGPPCPHRAGGRK